MYEQIIRFVRLEDLNWCKTAAPIGLVSAHSPARRMRTISVTETINEL